MKTFDDLRGAARTGPERTRRVFVLGPKAEKLRNEWQPDLPDENPPDDSRRMSMFCMWFSTKHRVSWRPQHERTEKPYQS